MQQQYLSVSALTQYIKLKLENDPHLKKVFLKGEISNFKAHSTGHLYFSLKDDRAQINAMMFSTYARALSFVPKDGDKVLVEGYISVYEARGSYSISIISMTLDGIGELFLKYEQLRKQFEAMGYFDQSLKKPIPKFPQAIAVITSPTGAVIQDIKTTVSRRYLLTKIILYPVLVQGEGSKDDLVKKIRQANHDGLADVIILGRGGGSIEDLWSFNEAEVVVAIHESKIPIITAIGHETDTTLSDFVGDLRAPTPTAAAELATPNIAELLNDFKEKKRLLDYYISERIKNAQSLILNLEERLSVSSPATKLQISYQNLKQLEDQLIKNYSYQLSDKKYQINLLKQSLTNPSLKLERLKDRVLELDNRLHSSYQVDIRYKALALQNLTEKLKTINPLAVMDRGFALTSVRGRVVTSVADIHVDDMLTIELKDGVVDTKVIKKEVKKNG